MRARQERTRVGGLLARALALGLAVVLVGCLPAGEPQPPAAPGGVNASQGTHATYVRIVWDEVPGARRYEIHRSDYEEGPYAWYADSMTPGYNDERVVFGQVYWYRVRACSGELCGPFSTVVSGYAEPKDENGDPADPGAPRNVAATQGIYNDRIRITWDPVDGASTYQVLRGETGAGPYETIATTSDTSYEDVHDERNELLSCHGYAYRLTACTAAGCSGMSVVVEGWRGTPLEGTDPPGGVWASVRAFPDRVRITWDPVPGATSYTVYRGRPGVEIGTTTEPSYDDVHAPPDNPLRTDLWYYYSVRACGDEGCGCGEISPRVEGRPSPGPGTPLSPSTGVGADRVTVTWTRGPSIEDPDFYEVHRATERDGEYELIGETDPLTTRYVDEDVVSGQIYWYRIRAVNDWAESYFSETVAAQVP